MRWLYHFNYFGPDRRADRFQIRFIERRRTRAEGSRASLRDAWQDLAAKGLKWVDELTYFGPDRRTGAFSFMFLERRKHSEVGPPPTLSGALRQLRVRVLEAHDATTRDALRERLTATAVLADLKDRSDIGDLLTDVATMVDTGKDGEDLGPVLQAQILRAEAMLGGVRAR